MAEAFDHMAAPTGTPLRTGIVIGGKFVLLRVIGEGAMSSVYEARDLLIGRHVALKILHPRYATDGEILRRFRREAEATARIRHPNVVMVHEMGQRRDGTFFIVEELLAGENLREYLDARRRLSVDEAIEIILPIMGALTAAHSHGIVHRDVKPENIVLAAAASGELTPKLVDFGIAKLHTLTGGNLTDLGKAMGTAPYMSPEQVNGILGVDARTDIWAVGVVLFELCSGICPFEAPSLPLIFNKILTLRVPRLDVVVADAPKELADIVERALDPDLHRRFFAMQAFRDELLKFASSRPRPERSLAQSRLTTGGSASVPHLHGAPSAIRPADVGGEWLDPDDLVPSEKNARPGEGSARALSKSFLRARQAPSHSDLDWSTGRPSGPPDSENEHATAAGHALRVNNLSEAIERAECVLETRPQDPKLAGRMLLVQASAYRWLGDYIKTERCAAEAVQLLPHSSGSWYAALGYVVIANGCLGRRERLESLLEEVNTIQVAPGKTDVHAILLCRLATFLIRTGAPEVAQNILADIFLNQELSGEPEISNTILRAWLDLARAELAAHEGDVATYLRRIESAVDDFTAAGDLRDACLQRSNIGNAYMQLGAHRRAASVLHESLDVAETMQLGFAFGVKANLGFALAHLNQLDQALTMEEQALQHGREQNNERLEAIASIYLAAIHSMRDELPEAMSAARRASALRGAGPALRAYGLATLSRMLLEQRQPGLALKHAEEAMGLLERLGGVEEGESLIRWVHALALRSSGREHEGRTRIMEAKRRLLERANRINEPHWRQSFLEGVRDNDRLLQLVDQWLGD